MNIKFLKKFQHHFKGNVEVWETLELYRGNINKKHPTGYKFVMIDGLLDKNETTREAIDIIKTAIRLTRHEVLINTKTKKRRLELNKLATLAFVEIQDELDISDISIHIM